ncbi:pilus assembly protein [Variovorax rhizosphaerae]|uniref:PilC/PilY family type IV pilus protein n=1 Tax=Variovorax rhizosphaerae TaxID=1836200 RepID=A0ABU8WHB9_9BURK
MTSRFFRWLLTLLALGPWALGAQAEVISDTLTGASSAYRWQSLGGACLTAGDGSGSIPKCVGHPYYVSRGSTLVGGVTGQLATTADPVGAGALRLTNGGSNSTGQTGAVYSKFDFQSNQGVEVTFKTVTYGGNGANGTGADGIAFFLVNGDKVTNVDATTKTGADGGSLGYSCANAKGNNDGLYGGYVGLGIDEFGNFANPGDNTATGPGFVPGGVTLRGAGNVNWAGLSSDSASANNYPTSLTAAQQQEAVGNTCRTGKLWNYSNPSAPVATLNPVLDYNHIATSTLPATSPIANQQGIANPTRGNAKPITYGLKITQDGFLSLNYSYDGGAAQSVINNKLITADNGPLPTKFRFGFVAGTGSGTNVHEIVCFKAAPVNVASSSAGINAAQVRVGTQLYLASYHPVNWWGQLTATNLGIDATGAVSISAKANWDGSCVLTGGVCDSTGVATPTQASDDRNILTSDNSIGVPFRWGATGFPGISDAQKNALNAEDRLKYLRGDRTNELPANPVAGKTYYRVRDSVLGDIINSSPTWVGPPRAPFTASWKDLLSRTAVQEGSSYSAFALAQATRTNVVYAGANDGMLHGFRAGAYDAAGAFNAANNDGKEVLAYMPAQALNTIYSTTPALDFSSPQYGHNSFVDATPGTGDLYYNGQWHTWLVGGLGAGGNAAGVIGDNTNIATGAIYALDVTTPNDFSEGNAGTLVVGEWSSSNLSCLATLNCNENLGSTYGTPIIRRMHDGNWAVIFGNGLNSKNGGAGIFIMTVDQLTGVKTFRYLAAGTGSARKTTGERNGIAYVTSADLDGDNVIDYLYAGDVFGNVWRYDVTSAIPTNWGVRLDPIFSTGGLPITSRMTVTSVMAGSTAPRLMVSFGTGQIYPQTLSAAAKPATGAQQMFGVWDWDMDGTVAAPGWNTKGSTQYTSLAAPQTVNVSTLQAQTVITEASYSSGQISGARVVSRNPICWAGSTACASGNDKFGWSVPLDPTEQIVYNPIITDGLFLVNTTLPAVNQVLSCDQQPASGFTMVIDPGTGAPPPTTYFVNAARSLVAAPGQVIAGIGLSGVGSPSVVSVGTRRFGVMQTVGGVAKAEEVVPPKGSGARLTWIKRR